MSIVLTISTPTMNQVVPPGQSFPLTGRAIIIGIDITLDSLDIEVDNEQIFGQFDVQNQSFFAMVQVSSVPGPHGIRVTATSSVGQSVTRSVTVITPVLPGKQPQRILEIAYGGNPDQPKDVDALYAQAVAFGKGDATGFIGGEFPSVDAQQEWKQVLPIDLTNTAAHEADYEEIVVGASGWALNPEFSGADVPFSHPFGFDWEFMLALDQPADDPKRYTFLLTPADQTCDADGYRDAVEQAADLKDEQGQSLLSLIPHGPDGLPSLLGVEIDGGLVPHQFASPGRSGVVSGDRIAVFGRWIVDCGHQLPITRCASPPPNVDLHPGIKAFRTEIHPPLLMAAARVTTDSIATGNPHGPPVTRVLFTSRPYLVGQRFTTDTDTIYDDDASDDGPFLPHLLKEVAKANTIFGSSQIEAHPKIKSKPFQGGTLFHFNVRAPEQAGPAVPGRLTVSFQFTHRSGCVVQVISTGPDSVAVFMVLNDVGYTSPPLPNRRERIWSRDELKQLDARAGSSYLDAEVVSGLIQSLLGGGLISLLLVERVLEKGIQTDEYDPDSTRNVNILDASHAVTAFADNIPAGQGVVQDDNQPYPVYGWLELKFTPTDVHP